MRCFDPEGELLKGVTKLFNMFCHIHLHDLIFFHTSNVPLTSDGNAYHLRYVVQFDMYTLTSHYN